MADEPLVSVVVCAYNGGPHLLPSVRSALAQTWRNIEVVVVDDGSVDGSIEAVRQLEDRRLKVVSQPNLGKPAALNRALGELRGDFYAVHDADDLSAPNRLERQIAVMRSQPDVAAVFCGHDLLYHDRRLAPRFRAKGRDECRRDVGQLKMPAHDPTGMYRVSLVGDMRYDTDLTIGQGYDYILRVGERHPMMVLGECLYSYRIHGLSATRSDPARREQMVREVHRRAYARRGETAPPPRRPRRRPDGVAYGLTTHFLESVTDQRRAGQTRAALRTAWQLMRIGSPSPQTFKPLACAAMPRWLLEQVRPA